MGKSELIVIDNGSRSEYKVHTSYICMDRVLVNLLSDKYRLVDINGSIGMSTHTA